MKLIKLSGIALSVALACNSASALANSIDEKTNENDIVFSALPYADSETANVFSLLNPAETLNTDDIHNDESDKDNIKLLDVTYQFLNEHVASGNTNLSFTVDGISFEFTTRIESRYGLLHLYGENAQGNFMRFIRGDKDSWYGEVSNGDETFSLLDTPELGGPGWFISSIRIPNRGDILINGQLPVPTTKENAEQIIDIGYTYTMWNEGRYGHLGVRASMLHFHYQLQDVLDNSGSGYYLNPVYIERQDKRFLTEEEAQESPKFYLASGWEYMFGEMTGAETMRGYLKDFGADFHAAFTLGVGGCGTMRNEYTIDDIGQPKYVLDDEEERADTLYGSLLSGTKHSCRNLNVIPYVLFHGFARPQRSFYEGNPFLPANKQVDFGGISDYAYAKNCGGVPTIFNQNLTVENLPIPVVSSPNITYKGKVCGDEKSDNLRSLKNNLPALVDNGTQPNATADVSFKSGIFIAHESNEYVTVSVVRDGDISESASVELSVLEGDNSLSAVAGEDFKQGFVRIDFAAGESEASVDLRIIDNDVYRENSFVELALDLPKRLNILPNTKAQLLLIDNDSAKPGSFSFTSERLTVGEGDEVANIKVIRSGDFEGSQMIKYSVIDGSARNGTDYIAENGSIVFAEGETEKLISIELLSDNYQNVEERSFTVQIDTDVEGEIQSTEVVIGDDEAATGFVAVVTETIDVDYHASQVSITLDRNDGDVGEITVLYETLDGTAIAGTHYAHSKGSVKFAAGEKSKTININRYKVKDETEQTSFTVVLASPQLDGAKIVTINLLPEQERESSDGGSLGLVSFVLFALTAMRRKRI